VHDLPLGAFHRLPEPVLLSLQRIVHGGNFPVSVQRAFRRTIECTVPASNPELIPAPIVSALSIDNPTGEFHFIYTPTSVSDAIMDVGYACTATPAAFREVLAACRRGSRKFGFIPLTEPEVARLLVAMGNSLNLFVLGAHDATVGPTAVSGASNPTAAVGPVLDTLAVAAGSPTIYGGRTPTHNAHPEMTWRHDVVATVLREDHAALDWHAVIAGLDFLECSLTSPHTFQFIVAVTIICTGGVFPTNELVRKPFANARTQIDALRHAIATPVDVISFGYGIDPSRMLNPVTSIGNPNHAWCCVDLYNVLFKLAQTGGPDVELAAYHIIDQAQAAVPELVLLAVARSKVEDRVDEDISGNDPCQLRNRVCQLLVSSIFGSLFAPGRMPAPTPQQLAVLARLWDTSRPLAATALLALARGLLAVASAESDQLRFCMDGVSRVVLLSLSLPDFATVLLSAPAPQLAIEVAVYLTIAGGDVETRVAAEPVPQAWQSVNEAGQPAGGFKLEAWLAACLSNSSPGATDRFAAASVAFLKRVVASQQQVLHTFRVRSGAPVDGSGAATTVSPTASGESTQQPVNPAAHAAEQHAQEAAAKEALVRSEIVAIFFGALKNAITSLTASTAAAVQTVFDAACKVYPGLSMINNQEIEELANTYFQRIYTSQQSMCESCQACACAC
jgi:hypothetical protein